MESALDLMIRDYKLLFETFSNLPASKLTEKKFKKLSTEIIQHERLTPGVTSQIVLYESR